MSSGDMRLFKVKIDLVEPGQDILPKIIAGLRRLKVKVKDGDILAVTSKVISISQGRIVRLDTVQPSNLAYALSEKYSLDPEYVELIISEADRLYGGTDQALCTIKDGVMIANAGVDRKNVPAGYAVLFPKDPQKVAEDLRRRLYTSTGKYVGVVIVDSRVTPLRLGTVGVALGFAGFEPVRNCVGLKDLYGKPLQITRHCQVDDLAGATHLLMGELDERAAAVLVRGAPIKIIRNFKVHMDGGSATVPSDRCLFINALTHMCEG
ncbi:MAG: coenzyme F420-0:L-glutamate ligase [Candidatus Bathyarchaeia archaeon]